MSLGNTSLLSRKSRVKCCTVYIYFRIIYYVRCVLHAKPLWYPQVLFKREPCLPPPQTGKAGFAECGELHVWLTLRYPLAGRRLRTTTQKSNRTSEGSLELSQADHLAFPNYQQNHLPLPACTTAELEPPAKAQRDISPLPELTDSCAAGFNGATRHHLNELISLGLPRRTNTEPITML